MSYFHELKFLCALSESAETIVGLIYRGDHYVLICEIDAAIHRLIIYEDMIECPKLCFLSSGLGFWNDFEEMIDLLQS